MINGSRLGRFVHRAVRRVHPLDLARGGRRDGLYIGVVALLTAFTLWLPVLPIGVLILKQGWFDSIKLGSPGAITSFVNIVYDPIVEPRSRTTYRELVVFVLGVGLLLTAFTMFDRALPNFESSPAPASASTRCRSGFTTRCAMFGLGLAVTALTMSVSISLTLLIPLSLKGYIRRDSIIPYVMGANIATWVDTLFAALLARLSARLHDRLHGDDGRARPCRCSC